MMRHSIIELRLDREPLPIDRHSRDLHIVKLVLVASSPDDDLMRATSVDD